jgi:hypothetical protein
VDWYVLFDNLSQALLLNDLLKAAALHPTIVPTPRALSVCCGMALLLRPDEVDAVRALVKREHAQILEIACIKSDTNPPRDRYC